MDEDSSKPVSLTISHAVEFAPDAGIGPTLGRRFLTLRLSPALSSFAPVCVVFL